MPTVRTFTEAGGHPVNEDAFGVRAHPDDPGHLLVALADGQGGRAGGARASSVACRSALAITAAWPIFQVRQWSSWIAAIKEVDKAVSEDRETGLTTLVGLSIESGFLLGASVGDSAVFCVDGPGETRELTCNQPKNPPVGSGGCSPMHFHTHLVPPWTVLVMSDGVWKYAGWDRIREAMKALRGQALIDALQDAARMKGSRTFQDDFTLIAIQDTE
ncbi:MAG: serine/threonine-protein phosphatase [Gemmataceae bacterium]|nr:serine/threonine-protein phosphatase [Gemmataceae bacterium]